MIDQKFYKKVEAAYHRIQDDVRFTPLQYSPALSNQSNAEVYLKLENFQVTGSFKARGATNKAKILYDQGHKKSSQQVLGIMDRLLQMQQKLSA